MADMSLPDAIAAIKVHARQMTAYQVIADAIDDVAKIDAMRSAASVAVAEENTRLGKVKDAVADAEAQIVDSKKRLQQDEAQGQAIIAKANAEAKDIITLANRDAEKIKASASADADRVGALVMNAQRQLETLNDAIAKAASTVTDREDELAAMEAKITAAKEQIAKMLGA